MANVALSFHDILEAVDKAKTKADRIATLHKFSDPKLKYILDITYNPKVQWKIPADKDVEVKRPQDVDIPSLKGSLRQNSNFRKLSYLVVPGLYANNLAEDRRLRIFADLCGAVHPDDAQLLLTMRKRTLPFKNVNAKLIAEAFPILAKNWE